MDNSYNSQNQVDSTHSGSEAIRVLASRLIDLSKRNRLLSSPYQDSDKRGSNSIVPILQPKLINVYECLYGSNRGFQIASYEDLFPDVRQGGLFEEVKNNTSVELKKGYFYSSYKDDRLQNVLYRMRSRSNSSINERGVNILFSVFGMIEWSDPASENDVWRAPLILLPANIEKNSIGYQLLAINEDPLLNPALVYKFSRDYDINFPDFCEDPAPENVENYLLELKELLKSFQGKFHNKLGLLEESNIGIYSFAKIAMFQELTQLGSDNLLSHPIINALVNPKNQSISQSIPSESIDLDDHFKPKVTNLVLDADASQLECIYRSQLGENLAIQGPPGTGKSQTIVNLIADAIGRGKKVLFVAEKRVALDVVKDRLDKVGLGKSCLVIHPGKAIYGSNKGTIDKKEILNDIEETWISRNNSVNLSSDSDILDQLESTRSILNNYKKELHKKRFAIEKSCYEIYTVLQLSKPLPEKDFRIHDAPEIDRGEFNRRLFVLDDFIDHQNIITKIKDGTPWEIVKFEIPTKDYLEALHNHLKLLNENESELLYLIDLLSKYTGLLWPNDYSNLSKYAWFFTQFKVDVLINPDIEGIVFRFSERYSKFYKFLFKKSYQIDCDKLRQLFLKEWIDNPKIIYNDLKTIEYFRQKRNSDIDLTIKERDNISIYSSRVLQLIQELTKAYNFLSAVFDKNKIDQLGIPYYANENINNWSQYLLDNFLDLKPYLNYLSLLENQDTKPVRDFVKLSVKLGIPVHDWKSFYQKQFFKTLLEKIYSQNPVLFDNSPERLNRLLVNFRDLDVKQLPVAQVRIIKKLRENTPKITLEIKNAHSSEISQLYAEFKKRRLRPLRKILNDTINVIQAIKPCFMMSPLSVSQYLPPEKVKFDLVIFDEASQIRMEDAIGSIFRGNQIIIVGDEHQLPPTSFFDSVDIGYEFDDEIEDNLDYESILTKAEGNLEKFRQMFLEWHYRSKDEALITFSNRRFYKNRLVTFPNSSISEITKPIGFEYVHNGIYDRGGTRTNLVEAGRVVDACIDFAEQFPDLSLGVVTFSEAQKTVIEGEINRRLNEKPELRSFFSESPREIGEPFMIKNLELIQGDERDVIFFSMGYGKDHSGKFTQNFGPLNQQSGVRRLNVAITRARWMIKVFCSFQPEELTNIDNVGVKVIKDYLIFARDGFKGLYGTPDSALSLGDTESPFEEAVKVSLEKFGFTVHSQVGCSGYRIDLGVIDPTIPGRYCLGIECDGAMYHSARTARDRDRLRQKILENLGWNIYRVWSRSWFENENEEIRKIIEQVKKNQGSKPSQNKLNKVAHDTIQYYKEIIIDSKLDETPIKSIKKIYPHFFRKYSEKLPYMRRSNVSFSQLNDILINTGPLSRNKLIQLITKAWGYGRAGKNIIYEINYLLNQALRYKKVFNRSVSDIFYPIPPTKIKIINNNNYLKRTIGEISVEEIYLAVWLAVKTSGGSLSIEDTIRVSANILGFNRISSDITKRISGVITYSKNVAQSPYSLINSPLIQKDGFLLLDQKQNN